MQIKINRNYIWSNILVDQLAECGVKYACISPGSRSTPLTYSISQNSKIKTFVHVDERSSGFFALGLAKKSNTPVIVITTSGTATAELYPAIIEAYQNRVPLIVCTADRPSYLRNTGANQTINQDNIYKNHIRFFYDTGLPDLTLKSIKKFKGSLIKAFDIASRTDKGPVHFNLQFEKPLEPDSFTDSLEEKLLVETLAEEYSVNIKCKTNNQTKANINTLISSLRKSDFGLITIGAGNFDRSFFRLINECSLKFSLPVFADATSGLRFNKDDFPNLITNYDSFLRSDNFIKAFHLKYIIHFGRPLTSPRFEKLTAKKSVKVFIANKFGDFRFNKAINFIIDLNESALLEKLSAEKLTRDTGPFLYLIKDIDLMLERLKNKILFDTKKINEVQIISEVLNSIPPNSSVMVGNSVPIRDLDLLTSSLKKDITIYQNRGASGIDGVISTASGISSLSKTPMYLIIGDQSFYYDINSLLTIRKLKIPLLIVLINNNCGAIFKFLPIAKHKNILDRYFLTPTNLDFSKIVQAFGIDYREIKTRQELINHIKVSAVRKQPAVFEIKTNSDSSLSLRNKYWKMAELTIDNYLRKYEV